MRFQDEQFYPSALKKLQLQIARDDQEVILSINSPTSTKARVDQDVILTITGPTTSTSRVDQEVILFIMGNTPKVQVTQSAYLGYRTKWRSTISTGWRKTF